MRQKPTKETFFSLRSEQQILRPTSVATEFVDTDWDEELVSEAEDNSPRVSLQSVSTITERQVNIQSYSPCVSDNHITAVWPAQYHNYLVL